MNRFRCLTLYLPLGGFRVSRGPLPAPGSSQNRTCEFSRIRLKHSKGRRTNPPVTCRLESSRKDSPLAVAPRTTLPGSGRPARASEANAFSDSFGDAAVCSTRWQDNYLRRRLLSVPLKSLSVDIRKAFTIDHPSTI